ncbi:MAG: hypothetical protein KJ645_07340 [Planctomycetes bacterium]|nr:hypothetical protein [Planctomycetota bacterium]
MPGAIFFINDTWVIDPDSAAYMGLARAVMDGEGYSLQGIPHTKYPPFYPIFLAILGVLGGKENYAFMHYVSAGIWVLLLIMCFLLFSGYRTDEGSAFHKGIPKTPTTGLIIALLMGTSIYMIQYAVVFLRTEIVYTLFSLGALFLGMHLFKRKGPILSWGLGFIVVFQCAFFTRMAGAALLAALFFTSALARTDWPRKRSHWTFILYLIFICSLGPGLWFLRNQQVTDQASTDYGSEFTQRFGLDLTKNHDLEMDRISPAGFIKRIADNGVVFCTSCAKMLLNSNRGGAKDVMKIAAGALCIFGLFWALFRRRSMVDYYCLFYLMLYLVWPFNQQQRFYMPILPFLFEYAAITLGHLNKLLPPLLRRRGVWYLFFALQVPLISILFSTRSKNIEVLGRYSYPYLAFAVLITLVLLVIDCYLLIERFKPGGMKNMVKTIRLALFMIYLLGFTGLGLYEIRSISENRKLFEEDRIENPVPAAFAKIETHPVLIEVSQFILDKTDPDTVIMSDIPKMLHILTQRRTVPFTFYGKQRKLAESVHGLQPEYVFYSGEIGWVYQVFKEACKNYEVLFSHRVDSGGGEMIEPGLVRMAHDK